MRQRVKPRTKWRGGRLTLSFTGEGTVTSGELPEPEYPESGVVSGASGASLADPAGRANKGQIWHWWTGYRWDAVLPTSSGWTLFLGIEEADAVVDSRQDARVTCWFEDASLWVLRGHDTSPQISRYDFTGGAYVLDDDVDDVTIAALAASDQDASPIRLIRTGNGRLWAGVNNGSNVVIAISDDDGENWTTANVLSVSATGVVMLAEAGTDVILLSTENDGTGRAVRRISRAAPSIASGNWSSESLPNLASGLTSDDHGMAISVDGHIYAVTKTTGSDNSNEALLYLLHRDTEGSWSQTTLTGGPDDAGPTRPSVFHYDGILYVGWGRNQSPRNAVLVRVPLSTMVPSSPENVFTSADWRNGLFAPQAVTAESGALWLGHNSDTGAIQAEWRDVEDLPLTPTVFSVLAGGVTESSAVVNARITANAGAKLRVSTSDDLSDPVAEVAGTLTADSVYRFEVSGLEADTRYYYGFKSTDEGTFKTAPSGRADFTIGLASCNQTSSNAATFARIAARDIAFFLHMGDWGYPDISTNSLSSFHTNYKNNLQQANQQLVHRKTPWVYNFDDHDFGPNNSDGDSASRPAALQAYREYVPHYPFAFEGAANDTPITQTFVWGGIRFVILDTRSESDTSGSPGSGHLIGSTQLAWLLDLIENFTEAAMVIDVQVPWIVTGDDVGAQDDWGHAAAEREAISNAIQQHAQGRVVLVHGDQHCLAADDGSNTNFATSPDGLGPPLFSSAPLDRTNSVKGGPYSEGVFDDDTNQYGTITFAWNGDEVTATFRGYDVDGSSETAVITFPVTLNPQ